MNAKDLKNSILQLAIQGKLVEQREGEGTAEELYQRIQELRLKLIKEGKIKKSKKLPEIIADDIPFDIPKSWKWVRFGEIVNIVSARRVHQADWRKTGIPFYRAREIAKLAEFGQVDNELFIDKELFEKYSESGVPKPGDLMVTAVGTLGKTYIVNENDVFYYKDASVICLENYANVYSQYIKSIMESKFMENQINSNSGGTTVSTLTIVRMNMYSFPLPPLEEQKRIVAKIDELLLYIEKYDKAYSEVEELNKKFPVDMQKSILQYAIQGKLVEQRDEEGTAEELYQQIQEEKAKLFKEGKIKKPKKLAEITEDEIPFDIPESWRWVRLGDITHNWGQKKPDTLFDYIDVGSIDNKSGTLGEGENIIKPEDAPSRARKIVKEGTVLYSTVRPYLLNICIINKQFKQVPIASTAFAVLHPFKGIHEKYLYFILRSPMFISYVSSVMIGVAYPAINDMNLLAGLIPLPPLEEQKRIVERIEQLLPYTKQLVK